MAARLTFQFCLVLFKVLPCAPCSCQILGGLSATALVHVLRGVGRDMSLFKGSFSIMAKNVSETTRALRLSYSN